MNELIFKILLFVILVVYGLIRVPFAKKCRNNKNIKSVHTLFEKINVFIAWLGMVFVPVLYSFTSILDTFHFNLPFYIRIIATLGLIMDCEFFHIIHKTLDDNWSPVLVIKDGQKLVKNGVYKYIRHPMYTQCWLWIILLGIVAANIFVEIFGIITWGFLYFTRVFAEEKMMIEQYGKEYEYYMKQTGRLLPKIYKKHS